MTEISRRWFLGGVLGVAAVVAVPAVLRHPSIFANGIEDDYEGLQAFFYGRPVNLLGEGVTLVGGEHKILKGGIFKVSRGLLVKDTTVTIERCAFNFGKRPEMEPCFLFETSTTDASNFSDVLVRSL